MKVFVFLDVYIIPLAPLGRDVSLYYLFPFMRPWCVPTPTPIPTPIPIPTPTPIPIPILGCALRVDWLWPSLVAFGCESVCGWLVGAPRALFPSLAVRSLSLSLSLSLSNVCFY